MTPSIRYFEYSALVLCDSSLPGRRAGAECPMWLQNAEGTFKARATN